YLVGYDYQVYKPDWCYALLEKMMTQRTRRTTEADFTEKELRYLMERSLGRLAFVCSDTQAHIMPVLFEFDGAYFYLSGWNLKYSEQFSRQSLGVAPSLAAGCSRGYAPSRLLSASMRRSSFRSVPAAISARRSNLASV